MFAAEPQATNAPVAVNISQTQIRPVYPAVQYQLETRKKPAAEQNEIKRYKNLSSQAWTTIATRQVNSSGFADARTHEAKLCLFSLGHEPW